MIMSFPERLAALQPFWGTWYLDDLLGKGNYGEVYRIKKIDSLGQEYFDALKWLRIPQDSGDIAKMLNSGYSEAQIIESYKASVESLRKEILVMKRLSGDSHIVDCKDFELIPREKEFGWDILIKMELLTPLPARFAQGMTVGDVINLGVDICDALTTCEREKIIHRDIKPDNIFVAPNGNYKLGDFGVAKQIEQTASNMTKAGTPLYMAPEVYGGIARPSHSVDLYSLGLVLHELLNRQRMPLIALTDHIPTNEERNAAFSARMKEVPVPPPVDGSVALKKVVCKACEYNPKKRYSSPSDMKQALQLARKSTDLGIALTINPVLGVGLNSRRSNPNSVSISSMNSANSIPSCNNDEINATVSLTNDTEQPIQPNENETKKKIVFLSISMLVLIGVALLVWFSWLNKHSGNEKDKVQGKQETQISVSSQVITSTPINETTSEYAQATSSLSAERSIDPPDLPTTSIEPVSSFPIVTSTISSQEATGIFSKGEKCYNEGNYSEALAYYQLAADNGIVEALSRIGTCYRYGLGTEQDLERSILYFEQAAEQQSVSAEYYLGCSYAEGWGVPQNDEKAAFYWKTAADHGDISAQVDVAFCYRDGVGVQKDPQEAFRYFTLASEQDDFSAMYNLGECYLKGLGTEQDYQEARYWLNFAYNIGNYYNAKDLLDQIPQINYQTVLMGRYYSERSDETNLKPIEWIVLKKDKGKVLLISRNALDSVPNNEINIKDNAWTEGESGVREWLNEAFIDIAFSADEQEEICVSAVGDKISLLSCSEAKVLFADDDDRRCETSWYVLKKGDVSVGTRDNGCCCWLLIDGCVESSGYVVDYTFDGCAIRPIVWINRGYYEKLLQ